MTSVQPPDPDHMRIGNADRERVVRQLNGAFAEGRLDVHELDERVAAAYAAKTAADLRPLTADLPGGTPAVPAPRWPGEPARPAEPPQPAGTAVERRGDGALSAARGFTAIFTLNVVIWAIASLASWQVIYFWPVWLLIPLALAVIGHVAVGGPRRTDERHRERRERRNRRRGW